MNFPIQDLKNLVDVQNNVEWTSDESGFIYEVVSNEISHISRWSIHYIQIFKYMGNYYSTTYSIGATEYQEEMPYEFIGQEELECKRVYPHEETVIVFKDSPS